MTLIAPTDVLIVDDDAATRDLVSGALARSGITCHSAVDGIDAVERLEAHRYLVLLLDLVMPRLDGAGVLSQSRSLNRASADRPVVLVLTACAERAALLDFADTVQAVIRKPFDIVDLTALIRDCVVSQRSNLDAERISSPRPGAARAEERAH